MLRPLEAVSSSLAGVHITLDSSIRAARRFRLANFEHWYSIHLFIQNRKDSRAFSLGRSCTGIIPLEGLGHMSRRVRAFSRLVSLAGFLVNLLVQNRPRLVQLCLLPFYRR